MIICPKCRGEGIIKKIEYKKTLEGKLKRFTDIGKCEKCNGKGQIKEEQS